MATHSSVLAWRICWTGEPGRLYSPWGCKESDTTKQLHTQGGQYPEVFRLQKDDVLKKSHRLKETKETL